MHTVFYILLALIYLYSGNYRNISSNSEVVFNFVIFICEKVNIVHWKESIGVFEILIHVNYEFKIILRYMSYFP